MQYILPKNLSNLKNGKHISLYDSIAFIGFCMQQQHFTPGCAPCNPSLIYKFQVISQSALRAL